MSALYRTRRAKNIVAQLLAILATLFGLFWLVWIIWTTLSKGLGSLNLALFTQMTPPPGETGGMLNAFFGSVVMSLLGIAFGAPIGVLAGTYLAEYSRKSWIGETVRFVNDILLSAPSIVLGLFVYTLVVAQMGHFSALAGAIAAAVTWRVLRGPGSAVRATVTISSRPRRPRWNACECVSTKPGRSAMPFSRSAPARRSALATMRFRA